MGSNARNLRFFHKPNEVLENKICQYFDLLEEYNQECFGGKLSIILLGSLSRGEGTWAIQDEKPYLLSDIEYFTIVPDDFTYYNKFNEALETSKGIVFKGFNSSLFHIDNSYLRRSDLSVMEKKLLTFDASKFGKIVLGEDVLKLLPEISIDNINPIDIHNILIHRVFSVLYYGRPLKQANQLDQYKYCLAKNSLDLMTVILFENGVLESGFINRYNAIEKLNIEQRIKDYFGFCLALKLNDVPYQKFSIEEMEVIFSSIVSSLDTSFKYPLKNILSNRKHITRRCVGIMKRSIKMKYLVLYPQLPRLLAILNSNNTLNRCDILDNYVRNGYPANFNK